MKILVSSFGKEKNSNVDSRFGRCSYFQIYNSETGEYLVEENSGVTATQGAGISAAQQAVDHGVEIVITGFAGPNAYKILDGSDVKIFSCDEQPVEKAIEAYLNGDLKEISTPGPAHRGMAK
ncbi:NifB/NifX family molybdenum-iron cluster-binding protein [Clostridium sediminicola]|uniref:NifB/NifX family molybdenum-iron cluster-binding protein n=1 Tax=Clostridium sediminicola TaxID=3114879 RepID=UPI0031F1CAE2